MSKTIKMKKKYLVLISLFLFLVIGLGFIWLKNSGTDTFPIDTYYNYDPQLPLEDSTRLVKDTSDYSLYAVSYYSTHNERVRGLLSIPKDKADPSPVIILLHGLGDSKTVDYIEAGHDLMIQRHYAVLRIDIANHGVRDHRIDHPFDLMGAFRYKTREEFAQTVFDLRRSVDYLLTRPEIDHDRIAYYGISLGGMIGTVFCAVEPRIKVPVIALAGGNFNLMYGQSMISDEVLNYLSIIDPINFVDKISPRPLLLLNADQDEVIPPMMTKLLYRRAQDPKSIIWYPSTHKKLPLVPSYTAGIDWIDTHL